MREQVGSFMPIVARPVSRPCAVWALIMALALACAAQAEWVWDRDLGWIDMSERPTQTDRGLFAYATGLFVRGDYAAAADVFQRVEEKFPESPFAIKSRFGRAKCAVHLGKPAEAAKLCDALLAAKPESLRRDELDAFVRELAAQLQPSDPKRAGELLNRLGEGAPAVKPQSEAPIAPADLARGQGEAGGVRPGSEPVAAPASDPEARFEAMFTAAVSDVDQSRDHGHNEVLLRQAQAKFRELLSADPKGRREKEAREYLDVLDGLLGVAKPAVLRTVIVPKSEDDRTRDLDREARMYHSADDRLPLPPPVAESEELKVPEVDRLALYYEVTRLLEPGYFGDSTEFRRAAKRFRGTAVGETARFYEAECLYRRGQIWPAFDVYEEFMREYAASSRRRKVVEREYAIGQSLADKGQPSRAEDVMEAVAHNASNGPLADDALMFVGRAQLARERFEDARTTFDLVAQGYPRSKWNRAAIFLSGVADVRHSQYTPDNELLLERAQRAFEIYLRDQPDGPFAGEAKRLLSECREKEAQALMNVAHFYERRHQPAAAVVYYDMVMKEHAGSASAETAKESLGPQEAPPEKANP
jgi:outer membrane protein assembly factor BamD (BamD/ComL family)